MGEGGGRREDGGRKQETFKLRPPKHTFDGAHGPQCPQSNSLPTLQKKIEVSEEMENEDDVKESYILSYDLLTSFVK
jgi:hypothetical protein